MPEFLQGILAYPTVLWTIPLMVSLVYWLFVVLGAFDIDMLDSAEGLGEGTEGLLEGTAEGAFEGAAEGAFEGTAEGAFEGAAEGAFEGAAEGALEGTAEGVLEGGAEGALEGSAEGVTGFISGLNLRSAPVTVVASFIIFYNWVANLVGMGILDGLLGDVMPRFVYAMLMFIVAFIAALYGTSLTIKPLAPVFVTHQAPTNASMAGRVCHIKSTEVTESFGQAEIPDGGAGLLVHVRAGPGNGLQRGDEALVIEWDAVQEVFHIEPMAQFRSHDEDTDQPVSDEAIEALEAELMGETKH